MHNIFDKAQDDAIALLKAQAIKQKGVDLNNWRYYMGLQQIGNLGISVPPEVQPFAFPLNWCRTYIDALEERMDVRMLIRTGEADEDQELRADWEANDLDIQQHLFHRDFLAYGRAFLSVSADPDGGRPRIRVESPRDISVSIDPLTRQPTAALRQYRDDYGRVECLTLYEPNQTTLAEYKQGKWQVTQRVVHNLGRVPIIAAFNRQQAGRFVGYSQLADLKPLVDMAGRVMLQLQLAMETVASPQKVLISAATNFTDPATGEEIDPWDAYLGAFLKLTDKDAKVMQLDGASLSNFHDTIKMLAEQASTVTGMPVRMMGQNSTNPPAEGAIRADEARLVKQVERLNSQVGAAWAWALGISERIRTGEWNADGQIHVVWQNPATPTVAQRADYLQKATGGQPWLSVRGAMHEMGMSQAQIDREFQWMEHEQQGSPPKELRRDNDQELVNLLGEP